MNDAAHRLSLEHIETAVRVIDPVFLQTPQFECDPLSAELGARVLLKVETLNPIRCFKGRGTEYWARFLTKTAGRIVCASAGNCGQAMAFSCRKRGVPVTIYASLNANPLKVERMRALGATVELQGEDFDEAKSLARQTAAAAGARFVEDGREVEFAEGAGTIGLELLHAGPFDAAAIPVGNGALIGGIGRVLKAHQPRTAVIAVQAAGAPAMLESWRTGSLVTSDRLDTIADGIGVRVPVPEALRDMSTVVDEGLLVEDETIRRAMRLLHQHLGIVIEPSGAAGVAAILEHPERFRGRRVATILCGGNLTPEQMYRWL